MAVFFILSDSDHHLLMDILDGPLSFAIFLEDVDVHPVCVSRILLSKSVELGLDTLLEICFLKAFFTESASFFSVFYIGLQVEN